MKLKNKTVLIFGGTGFIGSHLADAIVNLMPKKLKIYDNLSASSVSNIESLLNYNNVEFIRGDIRDHDVVEKHVLESDLVFNLAATNIGNSDIMPRVGIETNVNGVFNIFNACKKKEGIRVVHVSSGSVLGSSDKLADETAVLKPTSIYGVAKMSGEKIAEHYAKEFGIKTSILRYFHIYGPRQDLAGKCGVINIFLSRILQGKAPIIWGSGEQIKCFTYVADAVDATLLAAFNDEAIGNTYNVASDIRISIKDLADKLIDRYGTPKIKPIHSPGKPGENMNPNPDTTKIKKLDWVARHTLMGGLSASRRWVEDNLKQRRII